MPDVSSKNKNILVCTLGASWPVIPEVFGFLAPDLLDLYGEHQQRDELEALRKQYDLQAPHELWLISTEGSQTKRSLDCVRTWWSRLGAPIPLRIWTAAGTDQLSTQAECNHIRELTLRVVMLAVEHCGTGQLCLSLAGGRKTMSADLQTAGGLFGAHAWLHVVGPEPLPDRLRQANDPELFIRALPAELAAAIRPLVVGRGTRNELLDLVLDGRRIDSNSFAIALAEPELSWPSPPEEDSLVAEIDRRLRESSVLLGNYLGKLAQDEPQENWRSLYRLPPATIERLRRTTLGTEHLDWLRQLPKADLHRHLGGCLDLANQRRVGASIWNALDAQQRKRAMTRIADLLEAKDPWPWEWPQRLECSERAAAAAALLVHATDEQLQANLWEATEPRLGLKDSARGFAAYERPGVLTGSAVLTHPAAIEPYARALVDQARVEGLTYVEWRGSPHKYRPDDPASFLLDLHKALRQAAAELNPTLHFGFIWILDRRQRETMAEVIKQAVQAHATLGEADTVDFLLGLDLAGDEGTQGPEELSAYFLPAFRECLHITIHAGEGESAENIWQAAYHLHADRIGHGLSLLERPQLLERFRNRAIGIELCPTSNREVVGFADPEFPLSADLPDYPLRGLLKAGLPLTICTDNPGISRTTLAEEFIAAARMAGDLTLWQTLAIIRAAFQHAFLPATQREKLMTEADARIYRLISTG